MLDCPSQMPTAQIMTSFRELRSILRQETLTFYLQAGNRPLAGFYLHELEELAEEVIDEVPAYDGHAVADLTAGMLVPVIERLENLVQQGQGDAAMDELIDACNACHTATEHGYIVMRRATSNPFNQDFAPRDE